jgi:hypothetical protein
MPKLMKKMLLLAKKEPVSGTDSVPTAALNSILCKALMPEPITADMVERTLITSWKGNGGKLAAGVYRKFTCEVELASSGAAGTAPAFGALLESCGFSSTVTASTSAVYDLVSSGEPTLTLYGYLDGILFKLTGAKGNVSLELNAKGIPVAKFDFVGAYSPATDVAMPTGVSYAAFMQPKVVGFINTPTFSFHGVSVPVSSFSVSLANSLAWRELIGYAGAISSDRKPTGTVVLEMPSIATKDWAEIVRAGTTGPCQLIHGTTAGNIVQLDMPAVQLSPFSLQDDNGAAMLSIPFDVNPVNGNDELKITFK